MSRPRTGRPVEAILFHSCVVAWFYSVPIDRLRAGRQIVEDAIQSCAVLIRYQFDRT
jgi:hypothetical protein